MSAEPTPVWADITEEQLAAMDPRAQKKWIVALRHRPTAPGRVEDAFRRDTPQQFIVEVLGDKPTEAALSHGITVPWTPDQETIMDAAASTKLEDRRILVWSGNSVGKTNILAKIGLYFLYGLKDTIVITTAPSARQVEQLLWGEIRRAFKGSKKPLAGRQLLSSIKLDEFWYAAGYTALVRTGDSSATGFMGVHSKRVVVLIDESTGVPEEILEAAYRITTGDLDKIIAIGNPTDPAAWFVTVAESKRPDGTPLWRKIVCSSENHPNVVHNDPNIIPGAATSRFVEDMLHTTGSRESGVFRSAILGLPPSESPDTLISLPWIVRSQARYETLQEKEALAVDQVPRGVEDLKGIALGMDIAGTGDDLTFLSQIRNGVWSIPTLKGRSAWHMSRDVDEACELLWDAVNQIPNVRVVTIDDTGIGGAVSARWRSWQRDGRVGADGKKRRLPMYQTTDGKVMAIWLIAKNFGSSSDTERFRIIKDQMWWSLRESFREDKITIPTEHAIKMLGLPRSTNPRAQITAPIYSRQHGKIEVYDKKGAHGKERITRNLPSKSPDVAHSLMLAAFGASQLRADPEKARPLPTNVREAFEAKTRELIDAATQREKRERANKKGKGKGPTSAYQKRSR